MALNKQEQERIERTGKLSAIANREFLSENRELLVSFDRDALAKTMLAVIRLDFADQIKESEPDITTYLRIQEQAFLSAFDRGAIQPIDGEITSLGWDCIERMRRENGIGVESLPVPEPVITPQQKLESQVREDWKRLSSAEIKKRIANDRSYRETFERISSQLDSSPVTSHVVIPGA
jgi:hypothetical protein